MKSFKDRLSPSAFDLDCENCPSRCDYFNEYCSVELFDGLEVRLSESSVKLGKVTLTACLEWLPTSVITESIARQSSVNNRFSEFDQIVETYWKSLTPRSKRAILKRKKQFDGRIFRLDGDEEQRIEAFDAIHVVIEE